MPVELCATPSQIEMITCTARFQGWFAGRRWGKTDTFFNRATKRMLERPIRYIYISPGYALAKEQYERMCDSLRPFIKRARGQPKPEIWLSTGSIISFRSFDKPKFLKGTKAHEVFVDEIQDFASEVAFWSVIRPLISDMRGTLIVAGQFAGHNWYHKQFYLRGQVPGQGIYRSWKHPSATGIRFQDEAGREELRIAQEQLPRAVYLQQYDCEPLANQAAVFMPEDLETIRRGSPNPKPVPGRNYIACYDLGEMVDNSALVVFEYETGTIVHAEKIPLRIKHAMQAKKLEETARRYNDAQVVIDATAGGSGGQKVADENVKYYRNLIPSLRAMVWGGNLKREMVRNLSLAIENHGLRVNGPSGNWVDLSIPAEFKDLHDELAAFEFKRKGEDYIYGAPDGGSDNIVAALLMAVHAAKAGWIKQRGSLDVSRVLY